MVICTRYWTQMRLISGQVLRLNIGFPMGRWRVGEHNKDTEAQNVSLFRTTLFDQCYWTTVYKGRPGGNDSREEGKRQMGPVNKARKLMYPVNKNEKLKLFKQKMNGYNIFLQRPIMCDDTKELRRCLMGVGWGKRLLMILMMRDESLNWQNTAVECIKGKNRGKRYISWFTSPQSELGYVTNRKKETSILKAFRKNLLHLFKGFPCTSVANESACNGGETGSGISPGEGNGNPLQCSCLENPRDGAAWWAAVSGVTQSRTQL